MTRFVILPGDFYPMIAVNADLVRKVICRLHNVSVGFEGEDWIVSRDVAIPEVLFQGVLDLLNDVPVQTSAAREPTGNGS